MNAPIPQRAAARARRKSVGAIFAVPLLVGVASAFGLVLGLLGDGGWDMLACAALAPPVILSLLFGRGP